MINKPVDILSIKETRLDYTISNDEITIPDYALFRKDRLMSGGGVAVYISDVLNSDRAKHVPLNLEAVCRNS